jgi:hypothetical protein
MVGPIEEAVAKGEQLLREAEIGVSENPLLKSYVVLCW